MTDPAAKSLSALDVESLLLPVLVQLVVIIAAARACGALARKLGQPSVVGEILAGLLLGPSLFGALCPDTFAAVFRPPLPGVEQPLADAVLPKIFTVIAQFGLIFLLFLVGLELEPGHLRANGRAVLLVALAGLVLPFALGAGIGAAAFPLLEAHPTAGPVSRGGVALFTGLALAVTAIPVLGRIALELNVSRTRAGAVALAAAALSDALCWIALAAIAAAVRSNFDPLETLRMAGLTVAFVLALALVVRPLLGAYFDRALRARNGDLAPTPVAVLFVSLFACAVCTNLIGIFAVFGAFALGAALADRHQLREAATARLRDVVNGFFVPVFFTYTGLRTDVRALAEGGSALWGVCGAVVFAAVVGKLLGCGLAARLSGFNWKEAGSIGAMMNARGLMALVAINMGYELGAVPRSLFCVLVLMALITTVLTTPLLLALRKGTELEGPIARSEFMGAPPARDGGG
jgi:Kef-type K+ transport system membrane component KefB